MIHRHVDLDALIRLSVRPPIGGGRIVHDDVEVVVFRTEALGETRNRSWTAQIELHRLYIAMLD